MHYYAPKVPLFNQLLRSYLNCKWSNVYMYLHVQTCIRIFFLFLKRCIHLKNKIKIVYISFVIPFHQNSIFSLVPIIFNIPNASVRCNFHNLFFLCCCYLIRCVCSLVSASIHNFRMLLHHTSHLF